MRTMSMRIVVVASLNLALMGCGGGGGDDGGGGGEQIAPNFRQPDLCAPMMSRFLLKNPL